VNEESVSYFLALQNDDPSLLPKNLDGAMTPIKMHVYRPPIAPFDAAIADGKVLVFEELAKSRAVRSHRDSTGASVLHDIFANPNATAHHVNVLCKHMDPNVVELPSLDRPIHYATFHASDSANDFAKLEALINKPGIDVNAQNCDGQTAGHVLAGQAFNSELILEAGHNAKVIKLLDQAGADFTIKANDGRSAIDMLRGTKAARLDDVAAIIAKHDRQDLLSGLGAAWKPSDCRDDSNTQSDVQAKRRKM
jgi:hypothetical protein